jgi:hypothetical protein
MRSLRHGHEIRANTPFVMGEEVHDLRERDLGQVGMIRKWA